MRNYLLLLGLCWTGSLQAQVAQNRNSIRLGIDLTSLDAPDAVGPRYVGRLARHFANDRIVVAGELGYMTKRTPNQLFNEVDPGNNQRKRITADLTVFFDLIPSPRHALRIGPGLSAWYRQDDTFRGVMIVPTPSNVVIDRWKHNELNLGSHVAVEYDWLFHPNWSADVRLRLANIRQAGISSMLGAGVNYHF